METEHHTPTVRDAQNLANLLARTFPTIDSILLFGSVARGDANQWSDIDLLVTSSDPKLKPADLRNSLPADSGHVSLVYYLTPAFQKLYQERGLFFAHLTKEGAALYDPRGLLKKILGQPLLPTANIAEEVATCVAKLAPYKYPRRFNNNFLFCLSHLYSIGKRIIMLGLAKRGVLQFNREAAFQEFINLNPDLAEQVEKIAKLRPFYRLVSGRQPEPLPFSYHSAAKQMEQAVNAIESVAERVRCH